MTAMRLRLLLTFGLCAGTVFAQAPTGPVISPRGVINAFTQQPAPSTAPQGGLIHILGLNLGPPDGVKATGAPLPTQLGEPPIEVLINGKPAPLLSAQPERIVAQVPWEADPGLAQVVVRRGGTESRPARVIINATAPSVRTVDDTGYGEVAGQLSGQALTITGFGLGPTQPRVATGEAAPEDPPTRPRLPVAAFVGGLPARTMAVLSKERVGEFDIRVQVPAGAQPGDILTLTAGNRATGVRAANRTTFQKLSTADLQYVPSPQGAPEFRSLATSDLRGSFVIASAARQENGCYPSFLFDVARKSASKIEECLTAPSRNAATPMVGAMDGSALAALVGPPVAEPPAGVSSKVMVFNPAKDAMTVELDAAASNLVSAPGGDFEAVLPGTPPQRVIIDSETGETRPAAPAAPAGGAQPAQINLAALKIDLGDGLTHVLGLVGLPQNQFAAVVADDAEQPKKAKIAVVNPRAEVLGSSDFPEGWVPLVAPPPPQRPGAQPVVAPAGLRRLSMNLDPQKGVFYVLVRTPDNARHALAAFGLEESPAKLVNLPDGWFVAACSASIPLYNLELSRRLAFLGSNVAETQVKDPCPGVGFLLLDLETQTMTAVPLPGQGQFDADGGASGDVNDYIFGSNTDPARRNTADTLYVLDSVSAAAFRMDLPAGITAFASPRPLPAMNALIAQAMNRNPGDAGLVVFDLDTAEARVLPVPDGFLVVNLVEVFTTTRKVVARGNTPTGSQYLIYDLLTGDLLMPPNPEGVASVGGPPPRAAQTPAPGGTAPGGGTPGGTPAQPQAPTILQRPNAKSNTVTGFAYASDGKQVGVVVLRVP